MKDKLVQFYYTKLFWSAILWYRITQFTTKLFHKGEPVRVFDSSQALGFYVHANAIYTLDPLKGKFDMLLHPTVFQHRVESGEPADDCDGHAAFWLASLLKSKIPSSAWLATVWYKKQNGDRAGHAIAVWCEEGKYFWADYGVPQGTDKIHMDAQWTWPNSVMKAGYGVEPLCATLTPVTLDKHDGLKFGSPVGQKY